MGAFRAFVLIFLLLVPLCKIAKATDSRRDYSNNRSSQQVGSPSSVLVLNDAIWIGGENGLLNIRDNTKIEFDLNGSEEESNWVTDLNRLDKNHILISVFGNAIFVLNIESLEVEKIKTGELTRKGFWKASVGSEVFAVSTLNDIYVFEKANRNFDFSFVEKGIKVGSRVVDLVVDSADEKIWWIDSEQGLYSYSLRTEKWGPVELGVEGEFEYFSLKQSDGALFIGTDSGLIILDVSTQESRLITQRVDTPNNVQPVRTVLQSKDGTIWVAAETLYTLDVESQKFVTNGFLNSSLNEESLLIITDMDEDQHGNIFATDTVDGLVAFSNLTSATEIIGDIPVDKKFIQLGATKSPSRIIVEYSDFVKVINSSPDKENTMDVDLKPFYTTSEILFLNRNFEVYRDGETEELKSLEMSDDAKTKVFFDSIVRVYDLNGRAIFLINRKDKLVLVDGTQGNEQIFPYEISNSYLKDDGALLVTVDAVGLFEIDSDGRIFKYALDVDHSYHVFSSIYADNNVIAVGTSGSGAFIISEETKELEKVHSEPRFVRGISGIDEYWLIASNHGAYAIGKEHEEKILIGAGFGVSDSDFEFGGLAASEEHVILKGDRSLYRLKRPELDHILGNLSTAEHIIPLSSIEVSSNGAEHWRELSPSGSVRQEESDLHIKLPSVNYMDRSIVSYQYRSGNSEWKQLEPEDWVIELAELEIGNHSLEIRMIDSRSYIEQPVTKINIIIIPPWWRTWQAMIGYIIALMALSYLGYRNYLHRVSEQGEMLSKLVDEKHTALENSGEFLNHVLGQRQRIMANLSHEIRTPLALVVGPISQIMKSPADAEVPELLDTANRNALRIQVLVDQMLELEKLDYMRSRPKQLYDLDHDIPKITYDLKPFAAAKEQTLSVKCSTGKSILLYEDSLEKILSNLVSNAVKYTHVGGNITVKISERSMQLLIEVSDNGQGIPDDMKGKIFERYAQLDKSKDGVGVGLALVKELVNVNDGHIKLKSSLDEGTSVSIWLPLINTEYQQSEENSVVAANEPERPDYDVMLTPPLEDKLILIVDDNDELRHYLHKQVRSHYHCLVAGSGRQALEIASRMRPDLIVTDYKMPGMDGLELIVKVREQFDELRIPVIVMSAFGDPKSIRDALSAGADSYLTKPVESELLLLRIRNVLERQQIQIVEVSTENSDNEAPSLPDFVDEKDQNFYFKFVNILESKYTEESFNRAAMASEMAVSERQLSRKLRAIFDKTFNELLKEFRLDQAKQMLAEGMQVTQVGLEVGFSSPSQFSRVFRDVLDMTPTQYQQENAKPVRRTSQL